MGIGQTDLNHSGRLGQGDCPIDHCRLIPNNAIGHDINDPAIQMLQTGPDRFAIFIIGNLIRHRCIGQKGIIEPLYAVGFPPTHHQVNIRSDHCDRMKCSIRLHHRPGRDLLLPKDGDAGQCAIAIDQIQDTIRLVEILIHGIAHHLVRQNSQVVGLVRLFDIRKQKFPQLCATARYEQGRAIHITRQDCPVGQ